MEKNPTSYSEMPRCPLCGKPMRLERQSRNSGRTDPGFREWVCADFYGLSTSCRGRIPVEPTAQIGVNAIAQSLAAFPSFEGSDAQRKSQGTARRLASGIERLMANSYLSDPEIATLRDAAEILNRLGTAAELAKKILKHAEQEEERRRKARRAEAQKALRERYPLPEGVRSSLPLVLAMDSVRTERWRTPLQQQLASEMRKPSWRTERNAEAGILELIRDRYTEIVSAIESYAEARIEPVPTLLAPVFEELDRALREESERSAPIVEGVSVFLVQKKLESANASPTSNKNP